jgi:hypothetical protein
MSRTDRDVTRVVQSWLEEGVTALPDRVLDAVLDQLPATPQRRSRWSARRTPIMNKFVGFGLAAAAVVIAAFIGIQFLGGSDVGGPGPEPTPPPTQTPTPSAASSPAADTYPAEGALTPGTTYNVSHNGVVFTFAVPSTGWQSDGSFAVSGHQGSPEETELWFYTNAPMYGGPEYMPMTPAVFDDPCAHTSLQTFEVSLAGQAQAFASIPGTELVSGPSEVTVDSRPGYLTAITIPADPGCEQFWLLVNAECASRTGCSNYPNWAGETIREWVIQVDDQILTIRAQVRYPDEASVDLEAEIQQIVDSIQFE